MTSRPGSWETTTDVRTFLRRAADFLAADPVANTVLLTEASYVARHTTAEPGQCYGWWTDDDRSVGAAFVQAPRHPPLLSPAPLAALAALPHALPDPTRIGVDARDAEQVAAVWRDHDLDVGPVLRIAVRRLAALNRPNPLTDGRARPAAPTDRDLLVDWFERFREAHPEDRSDLAFVVDDPLADRAIVLWEAGGEPVAMASRTPVVAGMTRMGLVFSPAGDAQVETEVLAAACADAQRSVAVVLAMSRADDPAATATLAGLGFVRAAERVLLGPG